MVSAACRLSFGGRYSVAFGFSADGYLSLAADRFYFAIERSIGADSGSHRCLCFPDYAKKIRYQSLGNVYDSHVYIPVPVDCHIYHYDRH